MFPNVIITQKLAGKSLNFLFARTLFRPVFYNAPKFRNKTVLYDCTGSYSFGNLFGEAHELSSKISRQLNGKTGERVLFLCPNDASYVIVLWAIWMSGQIAVPLSHLHPEPILEYYINDTNSKLLVSSSHFKGKMDELSRKTRVKLYVLNEGLLQSSKGKNNFEDAILHNTLPIDFYQDKDAMILYTSGTTGKAKGVVLTHKNLFVQVKILTDAWKWSQNDVILHTLPLHHVHGTINALFCPLYMGATTIMLPKFNPQEVWRYLLNKNEKVGEKISVFMAVPTIYSKLIEEYEENLSSNEGAVRNFLTNNVRLMVSGSAPLPSPLYEKWLQITGHKLLERYGMTEIGMCLSNIYDSDREPGFVGLPLPSVSVALADEENENILLHSNNEEGKINIIGFNNDSQDIITGELLVKGDSVFKEYYNKPQETKNEFTKDHWFKTGDISQYVKKKNKFKMLGRKNADIIKSGGYKVSALQIETLLLAHPAIKECAVLGVSDEIYGERIAAVVVLKGQHPFNLKDLKSWASKRMPKYWIPTLLKLVNDIPKNAMGKINKKELNKALFRDLK